MPAERRYTESQIREALRRLEFALAADTVLGELEELSNTQVEDPACPRCGGKMWDNRESKRNPKAPDFKCRSRSCDGVIWPPR